MTPSQQRIVISHRIDNTHEIVGQLLRVVLLRFEPQDHYETFQVRHVQEERQQVRQQAGGL